MLTNIFYRKYEKVLAMSQLRAEILRAHKRKNYLPSTNINNAQLDTFSEFSISSTSLIPLHDQSPVTSTSIEVNMSADQLIESRASEETNIANIDEDISSESDWNTVINEWEGLLVDEVLGEEWDVFDNTEIDFLEVDIHPADNQAAKWRLYDLFLPSLPSLT